MFGASEGYATHVMSVSLSTLLFGILIRWASGTKVYARHEYQGKDREDDKLLTGQKLVGAIVASLDGKIKLKSINWTFC